MVCTSRTRRRLRERAQEIIARYPADRSRSALLPLLHLVQSEEGYVSAGRHRVLRRGARPDQGRRSARWRPSTRCTSAARPVTGWSASAPTRCATCSAASEVYETLVGAPRRRARRDHRRRQDHPGARRVPGRLRLRPGDDGQLRVLRQRRPARARSAWSSELRAGEPADADPRRPAVHAQGDVACSSPASPTSATSAVADGVAGEPTLRGTAAGRAARHLGAPAFDPNTPIAGPRAGASAQVTRQR